MMRAKKQTATGKELLTLLEEAREKVPQIRRYAKDTPQEFLRRVELRSSLLVEAGRQAEGTGTVPFYQFRHLTFQEYLAAVAAVEGHYIDYKKSDSALTPLAPYLTAEEWKEVIPMSAVLARKQAEPIMSALVAQGKDLRRKGEANEDSSGKEEVWMDRLERMPAAVARLAQCLAEEAEASPETLAAALQTVAFFARGCRSAEDWGALSRGPYGEELLHQAWLLYAPMNLSSEAWIINTFSTLAVLRQPLAFWDKPGGRAELERLLGSGSEEELARGLGTCAGLLYGAQIEENRQWVAALAAHTAAKHVFHEDAAIWALATWALALAWANSLQELPQPSSEVLDRLLELFLSGGQEIAVTRAAFALTTLLAIPRDAWRPNLTVSQVNELRQNMNLARFDKGQKAQEGYLAAASLMVGFHSKNVWPDEELATLLVSAEQITGVKTIRFRAGRRDPLEAMLQEMGEIGRRHLESKRTKAVPPT